jgi:hypothetical protein
MTNNENKLLLHALVFTYLITTPQATFLLFFFLLIGINVSTSYNSSPAPNPCCLGSIVEVGAQIARGIGFVLYKINRLVIVKKFQSCRTSPLEQAQEPKLFSLANYNNTNLESKMDNKT